MSFQDIFKSSFLERAGELSIVDFVLAMLVAFSLGLLIFFVYKLTYTGIMYSASFGLSMIALTLITTMVILAVTSNIILSLGMVGALSIVRFRTAVKEPMDIVYLFWSIAVGIVVGAGLIPLAVFCSLFIGVILYFFVNHKHIDRPYILVIQTGSREAASEACAYVKQQVKKQIIKSKSVTAGDTELTMEVRLKGDDTSFVDVLSAMQGVKSAVLLSYHGDYMS